MTEARRVSGVFVTEDEVSSVSLTRSSCHFWEADEIYR
jgi:hypothetical protein